MSSLWMTNEADLQTTAWLKRTYLGLSVKSYYVQRHGHHLQPPVNSGGPDNKGDLLHIMHDSSKYFLLLRLAQNPPGPEGNTILAITSKREGTVSIPSCSL